MTMGWFFPLDLDCGNSWLVGDWTVLSLGSFP